MLSGAEFVLIGLVVAITALAAYAAYRVAAKKGRSVGFWVVATLLFLPALLVLLLLPDSGSP